MGHNRPIHTEPTPASTHTRKLDSGPVVAAAIRGTPRRLHGLRRGGAKGRCYHSIQDSPLCLPAHENNVRVCVLQAALWLGLNRRGPELDVDTSDIRSWRDFNQSFDIDRNKPHKTDGRQWNTEQERENVTNHTEARRRAHTGIFVAV